MKIVIALGGNALGNTPQEQLKLVKETAKSLADLIEEGHELVVAHGNGPQVGMIQQAFDAAHHAIKTPMMPFAESGAMSQGYIGYHLQNAIRDELQSRSIKRDVVTLVTQVVVDENDQAFKNPTKPIGSFYSEEEAKTLENDKGYTMIEDSGRGYRRVIASPKPVDVVEKDIVNNLVNQGTIVITVGGGGIPVIKKDNQHVGVDAVIDKDFASAKVAELVNADFLFILTAVDRVMINFNTPEQKALESITIKEAHKYIKEGHFAPGSMLPKVEAAIQFAQKGNGKTSVIAALEKAKEALKGESGTKIVKE